MDLEIGRLSEVGHTKTNIIRYCLYLEYLKKKKGINEHIYKREVDSLM